MAGAGSRFANAGYRDPKPLINIKSTPMIKAVIENLSPAEDHRFIFICQSDHVKNYNLIDKLNEWAPGCIIIEINGVTEGAACTVLKAREYIDNNNPLMIANSDQFIDTDINKYIKSMKANDLDGLIMTMKANDPKWSYIGIKNGLVDIVVEKEVISNEATVGIYNFKYGKDYVSAADEMIKKDLRVNNEFYVAPTYNHLISKKANIGYYNIGSERNGMYGLGIPEDLIFFESHKLSKSF